MTHSKNNSSQIETWSSEVKDILQNHNLSSIYEQRQIFPFKSTIESLKSSMKKMQIDIVKSECEKKPKLRSFLAFKDFSSLSSHVGKPLTFLERKMISKLRLGILPLRIETGRYERPILPEAQRLCYCQMGIIESEYHALFECKMYNELREMWRSKLVLPDNFDNLPVNCKLDQVLNIAGNVRHTSKFLVSLMDLRRLLNKIY